MKRSKRKRRRSEEAGGARNVQHGGRLVLVLVHVLVLVLEVAQAPRQPAALCFESIETL